MGMMAMVLDRKGKEHFASRGGMRRHKRLRRHAGGRSAERMVVAGPVMRCTMTCRIREL